MVRKYKNGDVGLAGIFVGALLISLIGFVSYGNAAATLRVGEGLDPEAPGNYATIASALSDAQTGDIVRVESGVYDESLNVPEGVIVMGTGSNLTKIMGHVYLYSSAVLTSCYIQSYVIMDSSSRIVNSVIDGDCSSYSSYLHIEGCRINGGVSGRHTGTYTIGYMDASVIINSVIKSYCQVGGNMTMIGNRVEIFGEEYYDTFTVGTQSIISNNLIQFTGGISNPFSVANSVKFEQNTIISESTLPAPDTLWKNNILYSGDAAVIDENGNLTGDPNFVDFPNEDYHLTDGSPAINGGVGLDADGSVADIGMYGGVRSGIWDPINEEAGHPVVGHVLVTPNPVAPGEPLRIRFTAHSTP